MEQDRNISVVIPVYNSEESLTPLCDSLRPVLEGMADRYEIILVNDSSRDRSLDVITRLVAEREHVRAASLMRNFGQHNALLCGIRMARYDTIVTMDDDLQHPPEEIPALIARLDEGYDVVYGTPRALPHGMSRNLASFTVKLLMKKLLGEDVARHVSAFRAFRTHLRDAFEGYSNTLISIDVLLTWGTTRFTYVPVRHEPRRLGTSNYTFRKLAVHAVNMITGYSVLPLRISSFIGFVFTLFGLFILGVVVVRYFTAGTRVPGFAFLASIIAIFSGAQLFALGIIGEYLARIYFKSIGKPAYVVREYFGDFPGPC